jgi:hypothetical protein
MVIVTEAGGAPGHIDLRVYLVGNPVICNNSDFLYLNASDNQYQTLVANILTARSMSASIAFTWTQQSNGYCEITSIQW